MTEEQLTKALRRGDLPALEELLDRYTPYVSSVIARILRGRQADVEELTADVFLAAWDNRDKLRPGQVKGYLGAIARNRAFNLLRADPTGSWITRRRPGWSTGPYPSWTSLSGSCLSGTTTMARPSRRRPLPWG